MHAVHLEVSVTGLTYNLLKPNAKAGLPANTYFNRKNMDRQHLEILFIGLDHMKTVNITKEEPFGRLLMVIIYSI